MDFLSILHNSVSLVKPPNVSEQAVLRAIREQYSLEMNDKCTFISSYYDSFDWRLYRKHYYCCIKEDELHLSHIKNNDYQKVPFPNQVQPLLDLRDIPNGEMKDVLTSTMGVRKLMRRGRIASKVHLYYLRNEDEKIIARCGIENYSAHDSGGIEKRGVLLHCNALRGYETETAIVANHLERTGLQSLSVSRTFYLLSECGALPGDYTSKFSAVIEPKNTSLMAMRSICNELIHTMELNEDGLKRDIDPEFLHDFRVAIRRIRSALSLLRGVFPKKVRTEMGGDFKEIASHTRLLRDLDVYLGRREEYTELLPPSLKKDIQPFFHSLQRTRREALKKIVEYLESEQYSAVIAKWKSYTSGVTGHERESGPQAMRTVKKTASEILMKQFRSLITDCRSVDTISKDETIHQIRIGFKKLRYLLEFFSSLFAANEKKSLLKTLKDVQDILGNFNDCSVQIVTLENRIEELQEKGGTNLKQAAAIGAVITHLQLRKQKHLQEFLTRLTELSSPKLEYKFIKIFGG